MQAQLSWREAEGARGRVLALRVVGPTDALAKFLWALPENLWTRQELSREGEVLCLAGEAAHLKLAAFWATQHQSQGLIWAAWPGFPEAREAEPEPLPPSANGIPNEAEPAKPGLRAEASAPSTPHVAVEAPLETPPLELPPEPAASALPVEEVTTAEAVPVALPVEPLATTLPVEVAAPVEARPIVFPAEVSGAAPAAEAVVPAEAPSLGLQPEALDAETHLDLVTPSEAVPIESSAEPVAAPQPLVEAKALLAASDWPKEWLSAGHGPSEPWQRGAWALARAWAHLGEPAWPHGPWHEWCAWALREGPKASVPSDLGRLGSLGRDLDWAPPEELEMEAWLLGQLGLLCTKLPPEAVPPLPWAERWANTLACDLQTAQPNSDPKLNLFHTHPHPALAGARGQVVGTMWPAWMKEGELCCKGRVWVAM